MDEKLRNKIKTFIEYYEKAFKNEPRCRDWWLMQKLDESAETLNEAFNGLFEEATYEQIYDLMLIAVRIGE